MLEHPALDELEAEVVGVEHTTRPPHVDGAPTLPAPGQVREALQVAEQDLVLGHVLRRAGQARELRVGDLGGTSEGPCV